jgi:hypothetical protein
MSTPSGLLFDFQFKVGLRTRFPFPLAFPWFSSPRELFFLPMTGILGNIPSVSASSCRENVVNALLKDEVLVVIPEG